MLLRITQALGYDGFKYFPEDLSKHKSLVIVSSLTLHSLKAFFLSLFIQNMMVWGINSILVVDIAHNYPEMALILFSGYNLAIFGLPLAFGYISDRFVSIKTVLLLSFLINFIGACILIGATTLDKIALGLACLACGQCIYRGTSNTVFGLLLELISLDKEKAFTIRHGVSNAGSICGTLCFAFLGEIDWHYCFIIIAGLIGISMIATFIAMRQIQVESPNKFTALSSIPITISLIYQSLEHPMVLRTIVCLLIILITWLSISLYRNAQSKQKLGLRTIFLNALICFLYYVVLMQKNTSLLLFAKQYVNLSLPFITIPAPLIASMEPLFAVVLTKPICYLIDKHKITFDRYKYHVCFICILICLAMVLGMVSVEMISSVKISFGYILLYAILLAIGELVVYPPALAAIDKHAPREFRATLMGAFSLVIALAATVASEFTALTRQHHQIEIHRFGASYLGLFVVLAFLYALSIQLKRRFLQEKA